MRCENGNDHGSTAARTVGIITQVAGVVIIGDAIIGIDLGDDAVLESRRRQRPVVPSARNTEFSSWMVSSAAEKSTIVTMLEGSGDELNRKLSLPPRPQSRLVPPRPLRMLAPTLPRAKFEASEALCPCPRSSATRSRNGDWPAPQANSVSPLPTALMLRLTANVRFAVILASETIA